jgi:Cu-Zn family superoxide dismutase
MNKLNLILLLITINLLKIANGRQARCFMVPDNNSKISGDVKFTQEDEKSPVKVSIKVYGAKSVHGFNIHEKGSIEEGCKSAGAHYNPENKNHGGPESDDRHMGDLGNIITKDGNSILYEFENDKISLFGKYSIEGKTCVVHAKQDDLGINKDDQNSVTNGNSGERLACGVLQSYNPLYSIMFGLTILIVGISLSVYYFFFFRKKNENIHGLVENKVRNA